MPIISHSCTILTGRTVLLGLTFQINMQHHHERVSIKRNHILNYALLNYSHEESFFPYNIGVFLKKLDLFNHIPMAHFHYYKGIFNTKHTTKNQPDYCTKPYITHLLPTENTITLHYLSGKPHFCLPDMGKIMAVYNLKLDDL